MKTAEGTPMEKWPRPSGPLAEASEDIYLTAGKGTKDSPLLAYQWTKKGWKSIGSVGQLRTHLGGL